VGEYGKHLVRIYENLDALPQAYLVHKVKLATSKEDALKSIENPQFKPREEAVIEDAHNSVVLPTTFTADKDQVRWTRPSNNEVQVEVTCQDAGLLVLTDTYYPGWEATLDGKEVPIMRANYLFRGVSIPGGSHTVRFRYNPRAFWLGAAVSLSCLALAALFGLRQLISALRKKREPHAPPAAESEDLSASGSDA
jgi:hypothetical protein